LQIIGDLVQEFDKIDCADSPDIPQSLSEVSFAFNNFLTQAPFDPSFYQIDSNDTFNDILPQFPETSQVATQATFVTSDEESDWSQLSEIKSFDSNSSQSSQAYDFPSLSPPVASPSELVGEVDEEFFDNEVKIKKFNFNQKLTKYF
jgi:hypothetical protein